MRVIICKPGEKPEVKDIENELSVLQGIVDGYIEVLYPFPFDVCMICNDEGKLVGLPESVLLFDDNLDVYDVVAGPCIITSSNEGEDLTELEIRKVLAYWEVAYGGAIFAFLDGENPYAKEAKAIAKAESIEEIDKVLEAFERS